MMKINLIHKSLIYIMISMVICSCKVGEKNGEELIIFHAGSLSLPFREVAESFRLENPDIEVVMEAAGSRQCARKIIDLNRRCDIMASADYRVINNLLIPEFADWNIKFAGNEMAIVYHEKSRRSADINHDNWYEILLDENVVFGRSNPDFDPCGYRTVLLTQLAEKFYGKPGLADKLIQKDLNYIRPKEVDLIALLETDVIDYIFLYRSVAEQHKLKYLVLPDSINLSDQGLTSFYSSASLEISGKKPGETILKTGEAMVYGVTIVKDAPNREAAIKFVSFLLASEKGMAIMEENGQQSLVPSSSNTYRKIPNELKQFVMK
ncbi:MAG: tungstate ABC transporter substrate-binding protein WtpA [Bacteroidales bacterium]|nr:tungstate ABC transporter substrate-binding protein WtpA [Bacteroidales bacterium]